MGKIENQMGGLQGVASRFSVLLDDDSMDASAPKSKKTSLGAKSGKNKVLGSKKKQTGVKVDLQEAAFQGSLKTRKTKPEKKRSDAKSNEELEKLRTMFSRSSLSTCSDGSDVESSSDDPQNSESLNDNPRNELNMKRVTFSPKKVVFDSSYGKDPREQNVSVKPKPEKSIIKTRKTDNLAKNISNDDKLLKLKTIENSAVLQNQFKTDLEKKDLEILQLKASNEDLRIQLDKIKKRYKTTRSVLDEAEMKEKAQLVQELIGLRDVKDEMSQNIIELTKELEQYKTKTQGLNKELRNKQGKHKSSIPG